MMPQEPSWSGLVAAMVCLDFAVAVALLPAGVMVMLVLLLLAD